MFKTPEQLKEFILWAKAQRIQRVKVDKIEVEMSPLAFIDQISESDVTPSHVPEPISNEAEVAQQKEDDELQYWSSIP